MRGTPAEPFDSITSKGMKSGLQNRYNNRELCADRVLDITNLLPAD